MPDWWIHGTASRTCISFPSVLAVSSLSMDPERPVSYPPLVMRKMAGEEPRGGWSEMEVDKWVKVWINMGTWREFYGVKMCWSDVTNASGRPQIHLTYGGDTEGAGQSEWLGFPSLPRVAWFALAHAKIPELFSKENQAHWDRISARCHRFILWKNVLWSDVGGTAKNETGATGSGVGRGRPRSLCSSAAGDRAWPRSGMGKGRSCGFRWKYIHARTQ